MFYLEGVLCRADVLLSEHLAIDIPVSLCKFFLLSNPPIYYDYRRDVQVPPPTDVMRMMARPVLSDLKVSRPRSGIDPPS